MAESDGIIDRLKSNLTSPFAFFTYKKLIFLAITIFVAMNLVFFLPRMMPSNPAEIMYSKIASGSGGQNPIGLGGEQASSQANVLKGLYIKQFGINKPLSEKYILFWKRAITLDFGLSYWQFPTPVSELIGGALPWTLALILPVLPVGFVLGNWIGSRAAFYRGRLDKILYYITMFMSRAPYFWVAMLLMSIFAVGLGWFPLYGAYDPTWSGPIISLSWFLDAIHHYILPFLSLLGLAIGGWAVGLRAMVIYEMESDYVSFQKQLGFSKGKLREDIEKNAILPNFTHINNALSGLIGQTLLVEVVFGYPGLGTYIYNAVMSQDYPLIEATFMFTVVIVLIGNFVIDLLYGMIDPRIASEYVGGR